MFEVNIEELKAQRQEYIAELEAVKQTNLEAIKNARFEMIKEQIAKEVEDELNAKIAEIELEVSHYDFVINKQEEKLAQAMEVEMKQTEELEQVEG